MIHVLIGPRRSPARTARADSVVGSLAPAEIAPAEIAPAEIAAAAAGEPRALCLLVEWIRPAVARYCRSIVDRSDRAARAAEIEDLVRTVTIDTLRTLPADTADADQVLAWAYRVAAETIGARARPAASIGGGSAMAGLLPLLAPIQREVLTLRVIMGLSIEATVAVTGLTASAVRATQHRALFALRQRLAGGPLNATTSGRPRDC